MIIMPLPVNRIMQTIDALVEATSGSIAGACATASLYPLDVLLVRFQAASAVCEGLTPHLLRGSPAPGVADVIVQTIKDKGGILRAMYSGLEIKLIEVIIRNFVYFYWCVVFLMMCMISRVVISALFLTVNKNIFQSSCLLRLIVPGSISTLYSQPPSLIGTGL